MTSGPVVAVTTVCFTVLSLLSVAMRLIVRIGLLKNGGRDEIAICASVLASVALMIATIFQVKYGLGKHFDTISTDDFSRALKSLWISIIFYNISLCATKISIILQYMRVFVGPRVKISCRIILGIVIAYFIQAIITAIWTCVPIYAFWGLDTPGRCIDRKFLWFFNAAFNIFTDILIIALPMLILSSLMLPRKQKVGLVAIFALGGFVCLVSILRLHSLYIISISTDATRDNADASLWSNIEVNVGILCASLPTIKPLVSRIFPRLLSSNRTRQATFDLQPHTSQHRSEDKTVGNPPLRLFDLERDDKADARVEARCTTDVGMAKNAHYGEDGNDIYVMTSMTQGFEKKASASPLQSMGGSDADSQIRLVLQLER